MVSKCGYISLGWNKFLSNVQKSNSTYISSEIVKLQLKFCKRILGVLSKATNIVVYGELGRTPLIFKKAKLVVKYWFE